MNRYCLTTALILAAPAMGICQDSAQSMITSQARGDAAPVVVLEPSPEPPVDAGGLVTCLLAPARIANIASPISGLVQKVGYKRADVVPMGAVLVQLDDRIAASEFDLARITMTGLGQKLDRAKQLEASRIISRDEIEQLRTDYATAQAQVARAELALDMTHITAPFAGVLSEVQVEQGEVVSNTAIMQLIDISTLKVEMSFGRAAFGTMALGQQLNVSIDLVSKTVPATITAVDPFLDASSNTFTVTAAVANPDLSLPAGANCSLAPS